MDKNKSYNDIVEYYKNKNVNKKENITVDNTVSISYNEKVIIDDKELKQEQKENNNNNVEITKVKKDVETNTDENESTERKKRISLKKLALNIFTICIIGIVCGYFLGNTIISKVYMSVDYGKFDEINLRNTDEEIDEWESKKYSELQPYQIFVVAERKLKSHKYYSITGTGIIKNSFKNQDVKIKFYKNDDEFYSSNKTTGFINSVTAYFSKGDNVSSYKGTPKSDGSVTWKSKNSYNVKEFREVYGNPVDNFLYYIVSTKTIVEEEFIGRVGKNYKYLLKLTKDSSIINYVKQMSYVSGIDLPVFNSVAFEFTVDENFNLLNVVTHDVYVVNYVALVTCEGSSDLTFTYDEVPELETEPEVE